MFLPHLNAGNAPATAPAPVDFVPGFDDIETAPAPAEPQPVKPYSGRGFGFVRPKYVPQPVPVDVDEIEPYETETDSRNAGWTFDEPDVFDGDF